MELHQKAQLQGLLAPLARKQTKAEKREIKAAKKAAKKGKGKGGSASASASEASADEETPLPQSVRQLVSILRPHPRPRPSAISIWLVPSLPPSLLTQSLHDGHRVLCTTPCSAAPTLTRRQGPERKEPGEGTRGAPSPRINTRSI